MYLYNIYVYIYMINIGTVAHSMTKKVERQKQEKRGEEKREGEDIQLQQGRQKRERAYKNIH